MTTSKHADLRAQYLTIWSRLIRAETLWSFEIELRTSGVSPAQMHKELKDLKNTSVKIQMAYWRILQNIGFSDLQTSTDHNIEAESVCKSIEGSGVPPRDAIIFEAKRSVDVLFLGPIEQAADILSKDSQLLAEARKAEARAKEDNSFERKITETIALADAILATNSIDKILKLTK